ncbi:tripartite motif-containing protein 2-like [Ptychodera flava]|uniref:tripartite motif-containing protein 2-like n=1 Tax=Ptychodera flava TaxID=63121 RepID=UPI00396A2952
METYEEKVAKKSPFLRPVVCPRHDGNQIKLFCESCRLPVCAECALFDHPGPEHELRKLEAAAKTRRQQILQQVKYLKDLADVVGKLEMNEQQAIDGMKARLEKEEDKLWDRYNRHVMALRAKAEELQHQLRSDYDRRISSMQARLKGTTDIQRRLQATIQCTKNFLKESNDVGFLSLEKQTASNIQKLVRDIGKRPSTEKLPPVIEFTSNESFLTTVSSKHIGYVGEVTPHSAVRDDSKPSGETLKLSQKTRRAERGPMATTTSPETVDGRREMNSSRSRSRSRERDRRPRSRSQSPSSDLMRRKRSRTQSSQSPTRRMPSVIGLVPQDLPLN